MFVVLSLTQNYQYLNAPKAKKIRKGGVRKRSQRPETKYTVTLLNVATWALFKPDQSRRKFSIVYGIVARDQVSINIPTWREVKKDKDSCAGIKNDILRHFILKDPRKDAQQLVERAALMTAAKAWKQWKCTLVKEYMNEGVTPFDKYR